MMISYNILYAPCHGYTNSYKIAISYIDELKQARVVHCLADCSRWRLQLEKMTADTIEFLAVEDK